MCVPKDESIYSGEVYSIKLQECLWRYFALFLWRNKKNAHKFAYLFGQQQYPTLTLTLQSHPYHVALRSFSLSACYGTTVLKQGSHTCL